jgi:hypothetical protein
MPKFTKKMREELIADYQAKTGANYVDAEQLMLWVREQGPEHPLYSWFEWDDERAGHLYRIEQARRLMRGLRISFTVETIERGSFTVSAPRFISPTEGRSNGGGYVRTDPRDADHLASLGKEAAQALGWFMRRFDAVLTHVDADVEALKTLQAELAALSEPADDQEDEAA